MEGREDKIKKCRVLFQSRHVVSEIPAENSGNKSPDILYRWLCRMPGFRKQREAELTLFYLTEQFRPFSGKIADRFAMCRRKSQAVQFRGGNQTHAIPHLAGKSIAKKDMEGYPK